MPLMIKVNVGHRIVPFCSCFFKAIIFFLPCKKGAIFSMAMFYRMLTLILTFMRE